MEVTITEAMAEAVKVTNLKEWLASVEERGYRRDYTVSLRHFSNPSVQRLFDLFKPHDGKVPGVRALLGHLKVWIKAAEVGVENTKCRTAQSFEALAFEYLKKYERHWLFESSGDVWKPYYIARVKFHPREKTYGGGVIPPRTVLMLAYVEFGSSRTTSITFRDEDVRGLTVPEALLGKGYVCESADLIAGYEVEKQKFLACFDKIGKQYLAMGYGSDFNRHYRTETFALSKGGEPSRVVIDVLDDESKKNTTPSKDERDEFEPLFWTRTSLLASKNDVNVKPHEEGDEGDEAPPSVELPVHPRVVVFDLKRHARMSVHVSQITEYVYDKKMGSRLVLPVEITDLVSLLVSDKSEFRDIIRDKGGGAVILCAGPAGCGKTLTAEVYAEVMERPLYSVQCSQLGTDETELERQLLAVFDNAQRWSAILLLDEADVYVRARGTELKQNAIVGVFLRVLEYYGGVLFMTTNRSDSVDDAITSRCLARIDYTVPTPENQRRIWTVLAEGSGLTVPPEVVERVVNEWPRLSGRDVKQLLKLSAKVLHSRGKDILDFETVKFVKRFKPTPGNEEQVASTAGKRLIPAEAR